MRKVVLLTLALLFVFVVGGCNTYRSYSFNVTTGDKIEIKLDTSGDWNLSTDGGNFVVKKGETEVLTGVFGTESDYKTTYETVTTKDEYTVLKRYNKVHEYVLFSYEGTSGYNTDIIVMIKDSSTCVYMSSQEDAETVTEAFGRLTLTKK